MELVCDACEITLSVGAIDWSNVQFIILPVGFFLLITLSWETKYKVDRIGDEVLRCLCNDYSFTLINFIMDRFYYIQAFSKCWIRFLATIHFYVVLISWKILTSRWTRLLSFNFSCLPGFVYFWTFCTS